MDKINIETGKKYIPHFIRRESDLEFGSIVTHEDYNARFNLNTIQGDYNTETLRLLLTIPNSEDVPHIPYIDGYINKIIEELDTKTNDIDLATVAKSGSYTDLSDTPTKLSSFENDTNYVDIEELNNNLTNLSRELVMLLQDINKNIDTVENTANTASTNAKEALTLAQSYGETIANKQDQLTAGDNISIINNVISSTDTKYTAGANIIIDENNVISSIGGGGGSGVSYIAGDNIVIEGNVISAIDTDTTYTAGDGINIEGDTISSKPWFFTCSKGTADNINLTKATDVAEMYTKIINYYLKYAEIPQVYWYNGKLMQDRPAPYGTYLYCLKGLYISGGSSTYTTVSFHWESADSNFSNSTAKYGLKYFYQYEKYINTTVQFNRSELEAGEVNTLPTSHSRSKYTPYFLDSSEAAKIITTTNTTEFIPTGDYQPATKKYVDDAVANAGGTEYTAGENISISEDNVISAIIKTYSNRIMSNIGATTYVQPDSDTVMLRIVDNVEAPTQSAQLTTTDLTLSGVSVMNTLNEKVTNGNTTYPIKVYVQDTQPAAEEGYTVVWINTAV